MAAYKALFTHVTKTVKTGVAFGRRCYLPSASIEVNRLCYNWVPTALFYGCGTVFQGKMSLGIKHKNSRHLGCDAFTSWVPVNHFKPLLKSGTLKIINSLSVYTKNIFFTLKMFAFKASLQGQTHQGNSSGVGVEELAATLDLFLAILCLWCSSLLADAPGCGRALAILMFNEGLLVLHCTWWHQRMTTGQSIEDFGGPVAQHCGSKE